MSEEKKIEPKKDEPPAVTQMKAAAETFRRTVRGARDSYRGLPAIVVAPKVPVPEREDTPTVPIGKKLVPA